MRISELAPHEQRVLRTVVAQKNSSMKQIADTLGVKPATARMYIVKIGRKAKTSGLAEAILHFYDLSEKT